MKTTDSIFVSIKKLLGASEHDDGFDSDIIDFINSEFLTLHQLGVIQDAGLSIDGPETTWSDIIPDPALRSTAKNYVFLKAKAQFDPSASPTVAASYDNKKAELEFRMNIQAEGGAS